ncbi:MAG: BCCT family transporter [Muribaculaceae bacterium]|nr:BCCT family transporter [Muribaculaceae bacterium]
MYFSNYFQKGFLQRKSSGLIALALLAVILMCLVLFKPDTTFFQHLLSSMCLVFRGPVTIFCYACIVVLLFLVFSKYGAIRLGGEKAKPEFSTFSWLSCLFMAGCGIGIVFYCQEPILHYFNNPYAGKVPGDPISVAYSLTLFNWTINDWVQFALLGVIIAYYHYNRGKDLRMSSILPGKTPVWIRRCVDIIMALGVISGLTTSLGLGVTQIEKGFEYVFQTSISPYILMFIIAVVAAWSVTSGLKKGVKWLSNISTIMVALLMLSVVIIGIFSLHIFNYIEYIAKGTGLLFRNFLSYNDFYNQESDAWAAANPIFFNLWFAAWAAFVAVFVAKISKGRTIREFIIGVVAFPTIFTIIWFGIFGCVGAEYRHLIYQAMSNDVPTALFIFFQKITNSGYYVILSSAALLTICLFFITSSDSGSYVVATLLSKEKRVGSKDKIFWATIQCLVAMALYWCGGLALVQSVSVIMGILVIILIIIGSFFFIKTLLKDKNIK